MRHVQLKHGIAAVSHNASPKTLEALDEMMAAAEKQMNIKESPIIFSTPMVIAILTCKKCGHISEPFPCEKCSSEEFIKTQTRRVVKGLPADIKCASALPESNYQYRFTNFKTHIDLRCPYGRPPIPLEPVDRLWVRETHGIFGVSPSGVHVGYKARLSAGKTLAQTDGGLNIIRVGEVELKWALANVDSERWRPSIFMPRWASRIILAITDIKVEQLQSISSEDAVAEGVSFLGKSAARHTGHGGESAAQCMFRDGWDTINGRRDGGKYAWSSNCFVWVISFRRIKPKIIDTQSSID